GAPRRLMEIPDGEGVDVVPAIAESNAHGVFPFPEGIGDIVRYVKIAFVIARVSGIEEVITDSLAIDVEFVVAEAADVNACAFHFPRQVKCAPKQRSRV